MGDHGKVLRLATAPLSGCDTPPAHTPCTPLAAIAGLSEGLPSGSEEAELAEVEAEVAANVEALRALKGQSEQVQQAIGDLVDRIADIKESFDKHRDVLAANLERLAQDEAQHAELMLQPLPELPEGLDEVCSGGWEKGACITQTQRGVWLWENLVEVQPWSDESTSAGLCLQTRTCMVASSSYKRRCRRLGKVDSIENNLKVSVSGKRRTSYGQRCLLQQRRLGRTSIPWPLSWCDRGCILPVWPALLSLAVQRVRLALAVINGTGSSCSIGLHCASKTYHFCHSAGTGAGAGGSGCPRAGGAHGPESAGKANAGWLPLPSARALGETESKGGLQV